MYRATFYVVFKYYIILHIQKTYIYSQKVAKFIV